MQDRKVRVVSKGSNYITITTKEITCGSAKVRKDAHKNAPRVVIYGMKEKEYERIASICESLYRKKSVANKRNIRARLIREAISEALHNKIFGGNPNCTISYKKK